MKVCETLGMEENPAKTAKKSGVGISPTHPSAVDAAPALARDGRDDQVLIRRELAKPPAPTIAQLWARIDDGLNSDQLARQLLQPIAAHRLGLCNVAIDHIGIAQLLTERMGRPPLFYRVNT